MTKKIFHIAAAAISLTVFSSVMAKAETNNTVAIGAIAEQLKATFNQTTFTNFEPAPMDGWFQAEVSNQVVYFSPKQELMFFGEVYTKNGVSLSEQTRSKWQSKRVINLDVSAALSIGNGAIEIIEFTDTDCPFCLRFNRWIMKKNDAYKKLHGKDLFTRKLVLTPMDQLHPNAHKESVHVLCQSPDNYENAITQTLESKISYADMDDCQQGKNLLVKHRKIAKKFGVAATPTLVIAGQIIQGFNQQKLEVAINKKMEMDSLSK